MKAIITAAFIVLTLSISAIAQTPAVVAPDPFHFDIDVSQWGLAPQNPALVQFFQTNKTGALYSLQTGLAGTWWRDPNWVTTLGISTDQQKKMDETFQQYRLKLIDLNATLEKEELILEPLVESSRTEDQPKILTQIDRIAEARAELEKANARMLLGIRQVLTQDQWSKLPANKRTGVKFLDLKNGLKIYTK